MSQNNADYICWGPNVYKSLMLGDAYMDQSTVQYLFSAKPLPKSVMNYCQFFPQEQISVKFETKYINFHAIANFICEMAAILLRPNMVIHCDLVTPYGLKHLSQHCVT